MPYLQQQQPRFLATAANSNLHGVYLMDSDSNTLTNNNALYNDWGIHIGDDHNLIYNNYFFQAGISRFTSSAAIYIGKDMYKYK